ncbi:MAG: hypothetical protein ACXAC7_11610 [Candidatus Hodarchaeales archaeon]
MKEVISNENQLVYVSKGSSFGLIQFGIILGLITFFELFAIKLLTERLMVMLIGISLILFLLGVIIDQLNARGFRFWALGALISFTGVFVFFLPIVLYGLHLDDVNLWLILILIGGSLILFGYTVDALELNKKVAVKLSDLWMAVTTYQWRSIPSRIFNVIATIIVGFISYISNGIRRLKTHLIKGFNQLYKFISESIKKIFNFVLALPGLLWKTTKIVYNYSYLTLPFFGLVFLWINQNHSTPGLLSMLLILILLFLLGVAYQKREQVGVLVNQVTDYSHQTIMRCLPAVHSIKQRFGRHRCSYCNSVLKLGETECSQCQTRVVECLICKLPIKDDQTVTVCSSCKHQSHKDHWETYVIRMGKPCPVCFTLPT